MQELTNYSPPPRIRSPQMKPDTDKLWQFPFMGALMGGMMALCLMLVQDIRYDITAELTFSEHVSNEDKALLIDALNTQTASEKQSVTVTLNQARPWQWMALTAHHLFGNTGHQAITPPSLSIYQAEWQKAPLLLRVTSPHAYTLFTLNGIILGKATAMESLEWQKPYFKGSLLLSSINAPIGTEFILTPEPMKDRALEVAATPHHISLLAQAAYPQQGREWLEHHITQAMGMVLGQQHQRLVKSYRNLQQQAYDAQIKQELANWRLTEYRKNTPSRALSANAEELLHSLLAHEEKLAQLELNHSDTAQEHIAQLTADITQLEFRIKELIESEQKLFRLVRDAEHYSRIEQHYASQAQSAQAALLSSGNDIRITQLPVIEPLSPFKRWIWPLLSGIIGGALLGALLLKRP